MGRRSRSLLLASIGAFVLVGLLVAYAAAGGAGRTTIRVAVALACVAVITVSYRIRQPAASRGWLFLGSGISAFAAADLVVQLRLPATVVHTAQVAGYGLFALGMAVFLRSRYHRANASTVLDAVLVGLAACGMIWAFLVEPSAGPNGDGLSPGVVYPVGGALLVSLLGGALAAGARRFTLSSFALLAGFTTLLTSDVRTAVLHQHDVDNSFTAGVLVVGAWIALALASVHPTMQQIGAADGSDAATDNPRQRLFVVGLAAVVGPNVLFAEELALVDQLLLAGVSWLLASLVVVRMRLVQKARTDGEARLAAIVQNSSDLITIVDRDGVVVYASPSLQDTMHVIAGDRIATVRARLHPADVDVFNELVGMCREDRSSSVELRVRSSIGSDWRTVEAVAVDMTDDPAVLGVVITARDVTERVRAQEALRHEATHDPLTGLANRALIDELIERAVRRSERTGKHVAVLFLDLDRFKIVNDSVGHSAGDDLLIAVARRLEATMRGADVVGRLGGDEFVVVCEELERSEDAIKVADHILEAIAAPLEVRGKQMFVTASVGVAVGPGSADTLLREADSAMYKAKSEGRARSALFDNALHAKAVAAHDTQVGLRRALENEEFVLYCQPIHDLPSGELVAVETLLRWEDPTRGIVSPGDFLAVAEEVGLIVPIGAWVLEQTCRQLAAWRHIHPQRIQAAVNLSAQQLRDPGLVNHLASLLDRYRIDASELELELTESMLMEDAPAAIASLHGLHDLGIRLGLDDFGTGYSSLARLRNYPFETLKIDRSFVEGCVDDESSRSIVTAVIAMAHSLDMVAVAEGVETDEQLDVLRELGCDRVQGYLLGQPAPAAQTVIARRVA